MISHLHEILVTFLCYIKADRLDFLQIIIYLPHKIRKNALYYTSTIDDKVKAVNKQLRKFCQSNNLTLIQRANTISLVQTYGPNKEGLNQIMNFEFFKNNNN